MDLRKWITSLSLTAPLVGCCPGGDDIWHQRTVELPAPAATDAQLAALIDACVDKQDCDPLCLHDWTLYAQGQFSDPGNEVRNCVLTVSATKRELTYEGLEYCEGFPSGRRPRGYRASIRRARTRVGTYLAAQTALEAASVRAFADLHADLVAHGAPRRLRQHAIEAAGDEVRHAQLCARLARRFGARVTRESTPAAPRRTLAELALDNVVEGCVRETFGAVVAAYQAQSAADPAIREAMAAIAPDEVKHARLAWQLQRWLAPQLTRAQRAALTSAVADVRAELRTKPYDAELAVVIGAPDPHAMAAMLDVLDQLGDQALSYSS